MMTSWHGDVFALLVLSVGIYRWRLNSPQKVPVMPSCDIVYPKKYAHGVVVLCFVVVMQPLIMNSHEVFNHIHQGCFAGTGAIVRLPQCLWSKPDGYGKISQFITTTKHSKTKNMHISLFLGIYCNKSVVNKLLNKYSSYRREMLQLSRNVTVILTC